jgi:aminoglycoside phosphotransferase (APT) family kinase protein
VLAAAGASGGRRGVELIMVESPGMPLGWSELAAWGEDLDLLGRLGGGYRNELWAGRYRGARVAVRRSRRAGAALDWELDLLAELTSAGFTVPVPIAAPDGRRRVGGMVVFGWLEGDPPQDEADWRRVADELARLHEATRGHRRRPWFRSTRDLLAVDRGGDVDLTVMPSRAVAACRAAWAALPALPHTVVHGDPGPGNIRIQGKAVGLLDWDESRVDNPTLDLTELPVPVLPRGIDTVAKIAADAWEAANGWQAEPDYARRCLDRVYAADPNRHRD